MTTTQLTKMIEKWQYRLRVQDWDVRVRLCTADEIFKEIGKDVSGGCSPFSYMKKADILLLRPEDRGVGEASVESTLVHELLHLLLLPQDLGINMDNREGWHAVAYERAIEQLTGILTRAYGEKDGKA